LEHSLSDRLRGPRRGLRPGRGPAETIPQAARRTRRSRPRRAGRPTRPPRRRSRMRAASARPSRAPPARSRTRPTRRSRRRRSRRARPTPRSRALPRRGAAPSGGWRRRWRRRSSRRARASARCPPGSPSRCVPPFDSGEHLGELLEAREVLSREKTIDVRQSCPHPARERLILRVALERVDPDDGVRLPREPRHLAADEGRVVSFPAVAEDDHLPRNVHPAPERALDRIAARSERLPDEAAEIELPAAVMGAQPARAAPRPRARELRDQLAQARELRLRQLGEVALAEQLLEAPARLRLLVLPSRSSLVLAGLAHEAHGLGRRLLPVLERERRPEEPGREGPVEDIEILRPRDEGLAEGPVDVVLTLELDVIEARQRVRDPPRPHLEPCLAQHATESDHVAHHGISGQRAPPRRARRASRPAPRAGPRGTSAPSRASARRPPRRAPAGRARR